MEQLKPYHNYTFSAILRDPTVWMTAVKKWVQKSEESSLFRIVMVRNSFILVATFINYLLQLGAVCPAEVRNLHVMVKEKLPQATVEIVIIEHDLKFYHLYKNECEIIH